MSNPIQFDDQGNIVVHLNWKVLLKVAIILAAAIAARSLPLPGLNEASRTCLMIFVGAAGLWVTEAIPPFATAIAVIVLSIYLLGHPGGVMGLEAASSSDSYRIFLNPVASPVLVLFFGGFMLALAATKHGFDVRMARAFLKPFGTKPPSVLLGVILITAGFSMFMSNTATTAMMIAIVAPLFRDMERRQPFKKALVLAVPFAANIGGIGTIIGTPPNAVAASVLGELGEPISFFRWMVFGLPVALVMLMFLWFMLIKVFNPRTDKLDFQFGENLDITWDLLVVMITFGVTITLWLSETLHHIPAAVVALIPVMVFTAFGIIDREDLRRIEWHVLMLVAGGLTLGVAMKVSGLSGVLVDQLSHLAPTPTTLLIAMMVFAVVISNFMSNTSAANLLIPIATSFALISPTVGAIAVALACSMAMSLPISTPPNAIAFATEEITTGEMVRYGSIVSCVAVLLLIGAVCVLQ